MHSIPHKKKKTEMKYVLKYKLVIVGILTGALGGYLYYHFVGCSSGTCAITSKPFNSSVYGAVMGGLLASMFIKEKSKTI